MPYAQCRSIFETCQNDYVLFQAASVIKESIVREWTLLSPADIEALRSFLLQYVIKHPSLQGYVREQALQAVAVIFKRATLDANVIDKEALYSEVTQLIATGDLSLQLVACSILTALLNEFSSTTKSSSVGLTWEFHSKCKTRFEQQDLQRVFGFCLQVLHELENAPATLSRELVAVFNRMLGITEQVLGWTFIPKHIPKRIIGSFLTNQAVSFKPPSSWRDMVLNRDLLSMLFKIHRKVRYNSEMAHHSLQCLSQLATLNGAVFADDKARLAYLTNFITAILDTFASCDLQDFEALGFATILNNLVSFFSINLFLILEPPLLETFLKTMANVTCHFGQSAALEETMHKEDALYQEAYEKLLDSWIVLLTDDTSFPMETLKQHALQIFNAYLGCHLAPPDGMRNQNPDGAQAEDDEEYDEIDEDDRDRFADQLKAVGVLGRMVADHTVPLVGRLLEERVSRLHGQLQRMSQQTGGWDMSVTNIVNEDIHWLLLVSSNLLTDVSEGETPMIPAEILKLCTNQTEKVNLDTTLKVLSSPGNKIQDIPGAEQFTDPVVRLVSAVFRLCEVENRAIAGNLTSCLSPQVATSSMWFLKNWVLSYLLPNENYYTELSSALTAAFGNDSDGGMWTIGFLLEKITCNLGAWQSEVQLLKDTLQLLISMVNKRERAKFVTKCPTFLKLVQASAQNEHPCTTLPPAARRLLCRALVLAGSSSFEDSATKTEYWNSVLDSVHTRFSALLASPDLGARSEEVPVKNEILSLLESVCGVIEATQAVNAQLIYNFVCPVLSESASILELYNSSEDIVVLVLQLFNETASRLIGYLRNSECSKIYGSCLTVMQIYTKFNIGRKLTRRDEEEDQYTDICMLTEILTNLLSKDFLDFHEQSVGDTVDVVDVVLHGLNVVVPLMNAELLKFPALCTIYMRLLTYLAEMYPEKVCSLPEDLQKSLLAAVEYGIVTLGSDVVKLSLEFVSFISEHLCEKNLESTSIHTAMGHFLKVVFDMLVLDSFDMDLFDVACHSFFSLICCHQERYQQIVTELLQQQPEHYDRLVDAFNKLTPPSLPLKPSRVNRIQFMQNFDAFIANIRGFLCVR